MLQQIVDFFNNNGPSIFVGSFISAVISIVLAKWQMKKTPIIHCYKPMDSNDILDNVCPPDIYKSIKDILDDNSKLLKGWFINDGMDVVIFPNNNNMDLLLPKECEVLGIITVSSEDLNITSNYGKNSFSFLLPPSFLSNERFYYYLLYKGQDIKDFEIKAKTRIGNVSIEDYHIIEFKSTKSNVTNTYYQDFLRKFTIIVTFINFILIVLQFYKIGVDLPGFEIIVSITLTIIFAILIMTVIYKIRFKIKIKKDYEKNMKNIKLWKK